MCISCFTKEKYQYKIVTLKNKRGASISTLEYQNQKQWCNQAAAKVKIENIKYNAQIL